MKQKILLLLLGVLSALPALARDFKYTYEGQTITYTVIDEDAKTCKTKDGSSESPGNKVSGSLVLPANPKDGNTEYTLTGIGNGGFCCSDIKSVVIPNSVTSIGNHAFWDCSDLTSVEIPNSVQTIGYQAFRNCSGLTSVEIPNSVTAIYRETFVGCTSLTSVEIPNSVQTIGESAFRGCSSLNSVMIPNSVQSIGEFAFYGCSGLNSVMIPNSVQSIGSYAFYGCSSLTSVEIPNSVTAIDYVTFYGCSGLTSVVIGNSVQIIGESAFYGCSSLTSVEIPNSVKVIGDNAFGSCSGLTWVVIPSSVQTMGDDAFHWRGLKKCAIPSTLKHSYYGGVFYIDYNPEGAIVEDGWVWGPEKSAIYFVPLDIEGDYTIPESVTTIGKNAFARCSGLTSVKALAVSPVVMEDNSFEELYDTVRLSIPDGSVNKYLATNWSFFKNIQENSGKELGYFSDGVLEYRLNPTDQTAMVIGAKDYSKLQIPERFTDDSDAANPVRYYIKGVGYKAFYGKDVESVEFNSRSQIEYIGDYAFAGTKISSITLPETVNCIGRAAFNEASSLSEVGLNEGLASIDDYAFAKTNISSITLPETVKTIGDYAFYNTTKLSNVELKEGLESIGSYAFGSKSLRSASDNPLYLPSTVQSIGNNAFKCFRCSQVDISDLSAWCQIDFGNEDATPLCYSRDGLYVNGEKLTILNVPEGIKEIKPYAFYYCKPLEEVTFPEGLEKIGTNSFISCSNLTELTIPASVVEIGSYVSDAGNVTLADGLLPISFGGIPFRSVDNLYLGRPVEAQPIVDEKNQLSSLTIGNLVTEIPDSLFKSQSSLKSLTLGNSLQRIGDEAFSGCTSLEEVILPPSVETVGAEAFAGNSNLEYIIMGHKVKTIGEKAFDGCKANTVSITAQTPPTAPNNTFSNYKGKLYLQGEKAKDAYYDAFTCWDRFDSYVMIEAKEIKMEGPDRISGKAGDTFQLTATVWPEDATLPQIFWRATNPDIATVDANGLVTLLVDLEEVLTRSEYDDDIDGSCTIIAETLYNDGPVARIAVAGEDTGVDEILTGGDDDADIDYSKPYEVYNMNGLMVGETTEGLVKGIYIIRQGNAAVKTIVR